MRNIHEFSCSSQYAVSPGNDITFYLDPSPVYSLMLMVARGGTQCLCHQLSSPVVRAQVGV